MRVVAKRYAEALFELARERGLLDNVQRDIQLIAESIEKNETLVAFLQHPHLSDKEKKRVLLNVFGTQLEDLSRNFLNLLIDKGRQAILPYVVEEYVALANAARGVAPGEAVTAVALTAAEKARLESIFSSVVGKRVQLKNEIKPEIQGGVLVRIADRVYDGSIASKLTRFSRQLQKK